MDRKFAQRLAQALVQIRKLDRSDIVTPAIVRWTRAPAVAEAGRSGFADPANVRAKSA